MENGVWIRSGKACGQGTDFGKRHEQHHKAALDPKTNAFYLRNPARACVGSKYSPQLKKCDFEDLRQFIGLGFDCNTWQRFSPSVVMKCLIGSKACWRKSERDRPAAAQP